MVNVWRLLFGSKKKSTAEEPIPNKKHNPVILNPVRVPNFHGGMVPNIKILDRIPTYKDASDYEIGDIIIVHSSDTNKNEIYILVDRSLQDIQENIWTGKWSRIKTCECGD